ncbi:hypothetical protein O181_074605 [Austropuccinia psidii MF-1]|uniref:Uncharacterized protein n=1 Tax=Austropuccinia psidii MF-1 TaxID=1389203 RepID=A0A9Q3FCQ9_9BASI|nr:hypothetical protein [Austropuccinia psidii MF-1]
MILFTAGWRKHNPSPPKQVPKPAPIARRSNSNVKKQPQAQKKGKGKAPSAKPYIINLFSTSFHNLELSTGPALLKEVPKLKEWPHFSDEGEYDHMELIRVKDMTKEAFELPETLVTARFNSLFTRSANRWYIKLRQAHGHQSWTWRKTQIINKWANYSWTFKVETAFESVKFMINRKILRQCGGDLKHAVKSRTTEQSSTKDIINILGELTTRTIIGSSRVNLKTRFNTPWKDYVDNNPKENPNNIKYKSAGVMRKCHICQSTTHLANTCPKKGKSNEIEIEKEPNVEKEEVNEDKSDDKSSIFSEYSKDIENINSTFNIIEYYSHLPQLRNGQLDL